jgi:hypothetical protein
MKIVSWNIRGLGRVDKRNEVRKLVQEKSPLVVCVQETKVQTCDHFLCTVGKLAFCFLVSPLGRGIRRPTYYLGHHGSGDVVDAQSRSCLMVPWSDYKDWRGVSGGKCLCTV